MPKAEGPPPNSAARSAASPARATRAERVLAGLAALSCLAVLVVAAILNPTEAGHGTHTQLGMPACAWAVRFNIPCPTCGMTTSFAHAAEARWSQAWVTQPAGAIMALGAAIAFWAGLHVALFGSRLSVPAGTMLRRRVVWAGVAIALAAWGYKVATWDRSRGPEPGPDWMSPFVARPVPGPDAGSPGTMPDGL